MPELPDWIADGRGRTPELLWSFRTDAPIVDVVLTRESGEAIITDEIGGIYRVNSQGKLAGITRFPQKLRLFAWSDDGKFGVGVISKNVLVRFDRNFSTLWEVELSANCNALAIDPYGQFTAVGFEDSGNLILDPFHQKVGLFQTMRPVRFLHFVQDEPAVICAAEHGMLSCFDLVGKNIWDEKLWSNAGDMALSPLNHQIWMAGFLHGLQLYGYNGETQGSYLVEGSVSKIAVSGKGNLFAAYTLEKQILWMDSDSELLWQASVPFDVQSIHVDILGRSLLIVDPVGIVYAIGW